MHRIEVFLLLISLGLLSFAAHAAPMPKDGLPEDITKLRTTNLQINNATSTRSRRSTTSPLGNRYYFIVHRPDLGVLDDDTAAGRMKLNTLNNGRYQQWQFTKVSSNSNYYHIRNRATNRRLDGNGHDVYALASNEGNNQQWKIVPVGGDWFKLEHRATDYVVLDGGTVSDGGPVYMGCDNGGNYQQWKLIQH